MPPLLLLIGGLAALAALLGASADSPSPAAAPEPERGPESPPAPAAAAPTSVVFAPSATSTTSTSAPRASTTSTSTPRASTSAPQRWKVSGGSIPKAGSDFLNRWLSGLTFRGRVSVHAPGTFTDDVVLVVSPTTDTGDALDIPTALSRARSLLITSAVYQGGQITVTL